MKEFFINKIKFKFDECIYCALPPCKLYSQQTNQYGASDRFADRVCPMDIIQVSEKGEIIIVSRPLDLSNVQLICPSCGQASKIGYQTGQKEKIRYCKKCKAAI